MKNPMYKTNLYLVVIILALLLSACQVTSPQTPPTTDTQAYPPSGSTDSSKNPAYPAPGQADPSSASAYPDPANPLFSQPVPGVSDYIFKASVSGTASLHGVMNVIDITVAQPDNNDAIFLVPLPENNVSTIPQFTVGEVPQADVNEMTGEFMFTNVQPGLYAVVVVLKSGVQMPAFFIEDGKLAIVRVTEEDLNQVIELNNLRIP
jgi:hypothetical protein